jgi:hypothetical protein
LASERPTLACEPSPRAPTAMSKPWSIRASRRGMSAGSCWPSASMNTITGPRAARAPDLTAPPLPTL